MRLKHDNQCLWWKDWHSCSCGYLEEEVRKERKHDTSSCVAYQEGSGCEDCCLEIIPNTFAACGEYYGDQKQYCSKYCMEKDKK